MTYLTDEYWKKERQKERSKKRQQEMKTKVMKVYKENPDLSIKDIAELLKNEITEDEIVNKILEEYDVDEKTARKDVKKLLDTFKREGFLE